MLIPIERLRVRVGLAETDGSKDLEIMAAYEIANDIMENYLDRGINHKVRFEEYAHFTKDHIHLFAYPVDQTQGFVFYKDGDLTTPVKNIKHHIDSERGIIYFDGCLYEHKFTLEYFGGYTDLNLPKALVLAGLNIFDAVWGFDKMGATNGNSITRITLADVGTVSYDPTEGVKDFDNPYINGGTAFLLDPFRRKYN